MQKSKPKKTRRTLHTRLIFQNELEKSCMIFNCKNCPLCHKYPREPLFWIKCSRFSWQRQSLPFQVRPGQQNFAKGFSLNLRVRIVQIFIYRGRRCHPRFQIVMSVMKRIGITCKEILYIPATAYWWRIVEKRWKILKIYHLKMIVQCR